MNRIIIAGRTGTGKTTLMHRLMFRYGLTALKTCTDRQRRKDEPEDSYRFMTPAKMDEAMMDPEYVMPTAINGCRYIAKEKDLEKAQVMVLDQSGIKYMLRRFPQDRILIIYCRASQNEILAHIISREDDPETALSRHFKRSKSENASFERLEAELDSFISEHVTIMQCRPFDIDAAYGSSPYAKRFYTDIDTFLSIPTEEKTEHNSSADAAEPEPEKSASYGTDPIPARKQDAFAKKAGIAFRMEMEFSMDVDPLPELSRIMESYGFHERPVLKNAVTQVLTQTVPFLPDTEVIREYEKTFLSQPDICGCRFLGFKRIEMVPFQP